MPHTTFAVGSTNPVKVNAVRAGVARALGSEAAGEVVGVPAASEVPDQPMGDAETRAGACNRALHAAAAFAARHGAAPTFAVGLEGGCALEAVPLPTASVIATTAAAVPRAARPVVSCFAWVAVLHVSTGRWGCARTAAFELPPAVAALVLSGVELGHADDAVFGRTNSKQEDGAVGLLTRGAIDRAAYYEHAVVLALIPFAQPAHYP